MQVDVTINRKALPKFRMTQRSKWSKRARKCLDYQKQIAWEFKAVAGKIKFEGDLKLTCNFWFKNKVHGDLSNLIKAIEDGLEYSGVFENDKQIKRYGESGIYYGEEKIEILLEEVE